MVLKYWLVHKKSRVDNFEFFGPFQNDILLDSLASLTHEYKFKGCSL